MSVNTNEIVNELKWLGKYIVKYIHAILLYCAIGIIGTVMGLAGSVMTKKLIDIVTGFDESRIAVVISMMIGLGVGNIVFNSITGRISAKVNTKIQNEMQSEVYDKILESDWETLNELRSGDLLNRLTTDVGTVSGYIIGWIPNFITKLVQFAGSFLIIAYYDPMMALIAVATTPVSMILSKILLRRMREYSKKIRTASSDLMSFQEDSFQHIGIIKAFGVVDTFQDSMKTIQKNYRDLVLEYNMISIFATGILSFVGMLVSYACLGWAVYRLWSGVIIFGTMTLFLQLSSNLTVSLSALIAMIPQVISATTCAGRIMALMDLPYEYRMYASGDGISEKIVKGGLDVCLENIYFTYKNGYKVLEDIHLEANVGEMVAIVGPSGEGKTTILRILLGLVKPSKGKVVVREQDGEEKEVSPATRLCFSYVPQEPSMFAGTIADNLKIANTDATETEMVRALKMACAWEFVERLPQGIYTDLKERGGGLSSGQMQRIAIARALLRSAPVILLDEATSALDVDIEKRVLSNILNNIHDKTCIVTTHRPSVLRMCSRVYRMNNRSLECLAKDQVSQLERDYSVG
ncbi:MAG: ABC transporter ATP-binding protein/permease [Lachnospiraceae bacterium]|nr:ABC transporter ATP-binding protein/permease [Lachnospiraceae bacterium]